MQIKVGNANPEAFAALRDGGVIAGYCGHDHVNDFCTKYDGVNLCYVGSPGYTAQGGCLVDGRIKAEHSGDTTEGSRAGVGPSETHCVARRARVTELV